jgi:predicted DNA-binding ribbon-helix-helix protein
MIGPMTPPAKKATHGGRREGSGRKPFLKGAERLSISLEAADYEALERLAQRRDDSIAAVIRDAVKAYLARRRD